MVEKIKNIKNDFWAKSLIAVGVWLVVLSSIAELFGDFPIDKIAFWFTLGIANVLAGMNEITKKYYVNILLVLSIFVNFLFLLRWIGIL